MKRIYFILIFIILVIVPIIPGILFYEGILTHLFLAVLFSQIVIYGIAALCISPRIVSVIRRKEFIFICLLLSIAGPCLSRQIVSEGNIDALHQIYIYCSSQVVLNLILISYRFYFKK